MKRPGDIYLGVKLVDKCVIKSTVVFSEHKNFDGVAVPTYCKSVADFTMPYDLFEHHEQSVRITKLELAPDFAAIKAFEPTDIREGTELQ